MIKRSICFVLIAGLFFATKPALTQNNQTRAGGLACQTSASIGLIVGSQQRLHCRFNADSGWTQEYKGTINRLGFDLGVTAGGLMTWLVLAQISMVPHGALTGKFVGRAVTLRLASEWVQTCSSAVRKRPFRCNRFP